LRATKIKRAEVAAAQAIASRVRAATDEVKNEPHDGSSLDRPTRRTQHWRPEAMSAASDIHSAAASRLAARGPLSILLVEILPL
jgi:hypothetical protein